MRVIVARLRCVARDMSRPLCPFRWIFGFCEIIYFRMIMCCFVFEVVFRSMINFVFNFNAVVVTLYECDITFIEVQDMFKSLRLFFIAYHDFQQSDLYL